MTVALVQQEDGSYEATEVHGDPVCGKDFCDQCGDCLWCYEGPCSDGNSHSWVIYRGTESYKLHCESKRAMEDA